MIIGGYESGIDAAFNLVNLGKKVTVLSGGEPWNINHMDPSESLSPYTRERLMDAMDRHPDKLILKGNHRVTSIEESQQTIHYKNSFWRNHIF